MNMAAHVIASTRISLQHWCLMATAAGACDDRQGSSRPAESHFKGDIMTTPIRTFRSLSIALCATGAIFSALATPAAAEGGKKSSAQATYQADRAACIAGQTGQDRATCLREAGAALQEARRNGLNDYQSEFDRNRTARCEKQPAGMERDLCIRRMNGEGTTSGSAAGGGISRELIVTVPAN
jgi:hypothetical protein